MDIDLREAYCMAGEGVRKSLGNSKWKKMMTDAVKFYESTTK